jgi:hypothetical protein
MQTGKKRISNDDTLVSPVFSGDLTPDKDNSYNIGTPSKRIKSAYFSNLVGALTNFASLALTAINNQITLGTGTTTTINAPTPAASQTVTIPDSGTSSTSVILADATSPQTVNSILKAGSNFQMTNGVLQVQPDENSKSILSVSGLGGGANGVAVVVNNRSYLGTPTSTGAFLTDDSSGDTVLANNADSTLFPNASIKFGFRSPSGPSKMILTRFGLTSTVPLALQTANNQLQLGSVKKTTINATAPTSDQVVTVPDSGTAAANFVLSGGSQTINSSLTAANFTTTGSVNTGFIGLTTVDLR